MKDFKKTTFIIPCIAIIFLQSITIIAKNKTINTQRDTIVIYKETLMKINQVILD